MDVSPSTVRRLNPRLPRLRAIACTASRDSAASVPRNASIVAMSGRIIPEPLTMAVAVTRCPSMSNVAETPLGAVSVVMMARAARGQPLSTRDAAAAVMPAAIRSIGRNSPMTPVENGRISSGRQPTASAAMAQVASASRMPTAPVAAFALPLLTSSPRARPSLAAATATGGARKALWVNIPPTVEPSAISNRARSSRPVYLMPAAAVPTRMPGTGASTPIGGRFTATVQAALPWQCLNLSPEPQGHFSLRPTLRSPRTKVAGFSLAGESPPSSAAGVPACR